MSGVGQGVMDYGEASLDVLAGDIKGFAEPIEQAIAKENPNAPQDPSKPKRPPNPARAVQGLAGSVGGALGLPMQLMNDGFAMVTSPLAALWPSLPAATLGTLYVGAPHPHKHPPSLVPPNPVPIPLPSIGAVLLGTCVKVLINGLPAARAGDVGIAPTCGGFVPFFEITTGSSNVFIGGSRAARLGDACMPCSKGNGRPSAFQKFSMVAGIVSGNVAGIAGVAADMKDAEISSAEGDAAMAAAQSMAAAAGAAQLAADAAALAISLLMGKDDAIPPLPGDLIALSTVLIGGFPMRNLPDPLHLLFEKLGKMRAARKAANAERDAGEHGQTKCETCASA